MANPYFKNIMDAVDLVVQDNLRKKSLQERQKYGLNMLNARFNLEQEGAERELERKKALQELVNQGKLAVEREKQQGKKANLVALPEEIEQKYPALAGMGAVWTPKEVAAIVQKAQQQESLNKYRQGRLQIERSKSGKKGKSGGSGSDILKVLENLRKEAIGLLKTGYTGYEGEKEAFDKTKVEGYVKQLDELIGKIRSGEASEDDIKKAKQMGSVLSFQGSKLSGDYYGFWNYAQDLLNREESKAKLAENRKKREAEQAVKNLTETLKQLDAIL